MDPVSIVGLTGSALNTGKVIANLLKSLITLRSKYKTASLMVSLLIGQLTTIKAALNEVSDWIATSLQGLAEHEQLIDDLNISLESCHIIILILDDRVTQLARNCMEGLNFEGKIKFLWDESEMGEFNDHLNSQINALNLLLSAIHCRSSFDRNHFLRRTESRHIIQKVEDDRSSLVSHGRSSFTSQSMSRFDDEFDFDHEIVNTDVYRNALKSLRVPIKRRPIAATTSDGADEASLLLLNGNIANQAISRRTSALVVTNPSSRDSQTVPKIDPLPSIPERPYSADIHVQISISIETTENATKLTPKALNNEHLRNIRRPWVKQKSFDNAESPQQSSQDHNDDPKASQVMLFGCSNSGKTTLKRSIDLITHDITAEEIMACKEVIQSSVVRCIQAVLEEMKKLHVRSVWADNYGLYDAKNWPYEHSPTTVCSLIESSWDDEGFRLAFEGWSSDLALKDSTRYFLRSRRRVYSSDYIPSKYDVLRPFTRSTGFDTTTLTQNNKHVEIHDVGGRSERKKWIHHKGRNGPSIVIFTVSMSTFYYPSEGDTTIQLFEDLDLFELVVKGRPWLGSKYVLLFTKIDDFIRNMWTPAFMKSFKMLFPEFVGDHNNIEHIKNCFRQRFMELVEMKEPRKDIIVLFGNLVDPTMKTTKSVLDIIFDHVTDWKVDSPNIIEKSRLLLSATRLFLRIEISSKVGTRYKLDPHSNPQSCQ
ncbi:hypothetical protein OCU04_003132 [Sclerotinia nivalis]|uniref:G domain-containing protein n=1 Tax=Sclerotinia nivalis TaxID=352851 RepID=A0A9X0AV31_9HELO|nr:hypothetical protein OCU04_003132 [Sclerotinia nivalis]